MNSPEQWGERAKQILFIVSVIFVGSCALVGMVVLGWAIVEVSTR